MNLSTLTRREPTQVLVVDDDRDTAESMARLLRLIGHEVRTAFDGPRAIEETRQFRPDVVLLDIGLPGMDGYEVARRLRDGVCSHKVVIIAITGYTRAIDRLMSAEAGFDAHLSKPIDQDSWVTLISLLSAGSKRRQSQRDVAEPIPEKLLNLMTVPAASMEESIFDPIKEHYSNRVMATAVIDQRKSVSSHLICQRVQLTNTLGLHLRAADEFVRLAQRFRSEVRVSCDGRQVSGLSILDLTLLAAQCGSWLEVETKGPEAEESMEALIDLICRGFGEIAH